jgi:hypothetical protein
MLIARPDVYPLTHCLEQTLLFVQEDIHRKLKIFEYFLAVQNPLHSDGHLCFISVDCVPNRLQILIPSPAPTTTS